MDMCERVAEEEVGLGWVGLVGGCLQSERVGVAYSAAWEGNARP